MTHHNILLLMADDHRHDALGCAGDAGVRTPALDRLAADGVRLSHAHIMGGHSPAVCIPSRACLNTGRTCFHASAGLDRPMAIPADHTTLGEALRGAGYRCFHSGKWHLDKPSLNRSFDDGRAMFIGGMDDHWRTPIHDYDATGTYPDSAAYRGNAHSSTVFADAAIAFLESRRDAEQPFFLSCCFTAPHDPRTAPDAYHAQYPAEAESLPPNFRDRHPFDNGELDIRDERLAALPRTGDEVRQHIADYHAMIAHMDAEIARVLDALADSGHAEDTLVIYTADHGLAVGQHGLIGKQNLYEHSIRIPMILRGPGLPAGVVRTGPVYGFDLFPTVCELCGVPTPDSVEGRGFADVLRDDAPGRRELYAVYCDAMAMLKRGAHKLIRYYRRTDGRGAERVQLFDCDADPWECDDHSDDPAWATVRDELEQALIAAQRDLGDPLAASGRPQ